MIIAADVLEHVRRPDRVLADARELLAPNGVVVACVPNFGHWYRARASRAAGFAYERRGIFDAGHVRFFTRRTFAALVDDVGSAIGREQALGLPFEVLGRGARERRDALSAALGRVDRASGHRLAEPVRLQFLAELRRTRESTV